MKAMADSGIAVVLRDAPFTACAVRLPRAPAASAPSSSPQAEQVNLAPRAQALAAIEAAAHAEGARQGRDEGLRIGQEEGLRRGLAQGDEKARVAAEAAALTAQSQLEDRFVQLDRLLGAIATAAADAWTAAEEDMLVLCYQTVCRVVGEAATTLEGVRAQVLAALTDGDLRGAITLHLHPADARLLDEASDQRQLSNVDGEALRWRADQRVTLGGCIVAGSGDAIDARLETVLELFKTGLLQVRTNRASTRTATEILS